jgi:zinc protease
MLLCRRERKASESKLNPTPVSWRPCRNRFVPGENLMNLQRLIACFALAVLAVPVAVIAQDARPAAKVAAVAAKPVAGLQLVTSVEGITEYRMANGLRVLLFPDASKPTVTVNVTYLVGSRHENYGETGMAHLLEHLVFKGTPKNPSIDQQFNKRGMRTNSSAAGPHQLLRAVQASDDNLKWASRWKPTAWSMRWCAARTWTPR